MRQLLAFLLCVGFSSGLSAGSKTITANIVQLGVVTSQYGNVKFDTPLDIAGHPCATSSELGSFDKATPHGEHIFTMLLSAHMAGRPVKIYYSDNACGLWSSQALISRVYIEN